MIRHALAVCALGSFVLFACSEDQEPPPAEVGRSGKDAGTGTSSSSGGTGTSSSSGSTQNLPPAPTDPAGFCQAIMDTTITNVGTCCPNDLDAPIVQFLKGIQSLALPQCTDRLTKSLGNGRITYDPAKASSCLGAMTIAKDQCVANGVGKATSADCDLVYRGTVAEGGTCDGDIECADGLPCQGTVCTR